MAVLIIMSKMTFVTTPNSVNLVSTFEPEHIVKLTLKIASGITESLYVLHQFLLLVQREHNEQCIGNYRDTS